MAPKPEPPEEAPDESWMATFADMVTLLMAFFVMLLNFSKIDIPKFEAVAAGIANEIGMGENSAEQPVEVMKQAVEDIIVEMQADQVVDVQTDEDGSLVIEMAAAAFYKSGSAEFRAQAIPVLQKIGELLNAPRFKAYQIEVAGHTDDDPIRTTKFPSNWELSAGRATSIVRYFISLKMDRRRMKAAGLADTRPKYPNRDKEGNPITENQMENRRIVMTATAMSLQERAQVFGDAKYGLVKQKMGEEDDKEKKRIKSNSKSTSVLPKKE